MPLFYLCLAFLAGILLAGLARWAAWIWLAVAGGALGGAVCFFLFRTRLSRLFQPRWTRLLSLLHLHPAAVPPLLIRQLPLLLLAALACGAARHAAAQPVLDAPGFIANFNDRGQRFSITGVLSEPPDVRDAATYLRVDVEEIRPADGFRHAPVSGVLLARVDPGEDWRYGDFVVVTGYLQTPPEFEDFSYRDYLARQGIYSYAPFASAALLERGRGSPVLRAVFGLKGRMFETLHALFPDPEASLLAGILLGIESGLAPDLQDAFRDTGTSHIIAISGFNISILAAIFTSAFGRVLGRRLGTALAIAAIVLYTILVGADAAVVRAAVMGVMAIALRQAGRATTGLNALVLAAAVMAFANPSILADPGFQLSFAATLGLVLYADPLSEGFSRLASRYLRISAVRRIRPFVTDAFLLTLAAQITTLPVVVYHFGRLSLTAFLVNPLILPVQPAVMVLGGAAALAGLGWMPLGRVAALLAYPFTSYTIRLVELFAQVQGGVVVVGGTGVVLVTAVSLLPLVARALNQTGLLAGRVFPAWRIALLGALVALSVFVWKTNLASAGGVLRVTLLDVGMGEAVLIQTPADRWVLVNGGASAVRLSDQLGRRIPVSQRELDWLVVAGTSDAQLAALPRVLEQYRPRAALWAGTQSISQTTRSMQEILRNAGVPIVYPEPGQVLDLGSGAALEILAVTRRGAVLRLSWGALQMLLPIGVDFEALEADYGSANILMLAESGFVPLNPPEWIAAVDPDVLLLSVAAGNRDGLPSEELREILESYTVLRTDRDGWIEIVTDGEEVWVATGGS
ncbi:MAG TPA: ComEC/Rec2 family competence protein [Anaerolineales bacterium]|nr:ComEC/Rec2 family competence protein [Anaerolineales bacterium]